jgi:ArsR family metal-binding transcriptional regulator
MLLQSYDLDVTTMACDCHQASLAAYAHLHQNVAAVFPFLNVVCPGAVYDSSDQVITWKQPDHAIALRPTELAISGVADREDGVRSVEEVATLVNDTWERRANIVPSSRKRVRAAALSIYRTLPGGNCKACGEETCWIFAGKLSGELADPDACTPLLQDANAARRSALRHLLAGAEG